MVEWATLNHIHQKLGKWVQILMKAATMASLTPENVFSKNIKMEAGEALSCSSQIPLLIRCDFNNVVVLLPAPP